MAKFHRKEVVEAISFDELVAHGIEQCKAEARGTNIVNGMPWSFNYGAYAVTHENDDLYIVGPFNFSRGNMLVTEGGSVRIVAGSTFAQKYEPAHLSLRAVPQDVAEPVASDLHPSTADLVDRFAVALKEKLAAAEKKYGYSDGWDNIAWMDECREHLMEHVAKGDPRDVAAYCAFLWHHDEPTNIIGAATPPDREALLLAKDAERLDWLEADLRLGDEAVAIEYRDGRFCFPYLVSNDGGVGGGVGDMAFDTLRAAIDAAINAALEAKK